MADVILSLEMLQTPLRYGLGVLLAVASALAVVSWMERTRRIGAFSPLARFARNTIDPMLARMDHFVARAGSRRTSTPWWALFALLVIGAMLIALVDFGRDVLASAYASTALGPRGVARMLMAWGFSLLQLAILVRVLTSWIGGSYRWAGRTAFRMTEWLLRPLRTLFAPLGAIDFSPLIAWVLVSLVRAAVLGVL